jgi:YesN/AraC family two-component response regulator
MQISKINLLIVIIWAVFTAGYANCYAGSDSTDISANENILDKDTINELRQIVAINPDLVIQKLSDEYKNIVTHADSKTILNVNYLLGLAYYFNGNYLISNYYYDNIIRVEPYDNDINILEAAYNNKGVNLELLGLFEFAVDMYFKSKDIAESRGNKLGVGQSIMNIGVLFSRLGNRDKAISLNNEALELFELLGDTYHAALANMNYGAYLSSHDFENSEKKLSLAITEFQRLNEKYRISETQYHQAQLYFSQKDYFKSLNKAIESLDTQQPDTFNNLKFNTIVVKIASYVQLGRPVNAIPLIDLVKTELDKGFMLGSESMDSFWSYSDEVLGQLDLIDEKQNIREYKSIMESRIDSLRTQLVARQLEFLANVSTAYADSVMIALNKQSNYIPKSFPFLWVYGFISTLIIVGLSYMLLIKKHSNKVKHNFDPQTFLELLNNIESSKRSDIIEPDNDTDEKTHMRELFKKINVLIVEEKLFKEQELSRDILAKKLHTNTKYISSAIKHQTGLSFNDYINSCAIAEAIKLMKNSEYAGSNQEISEQCGFSSESSYYRNFKKVTGMSPKNFSSKLEKKKQLSC